MGSIKLPGITEDPVATVKELLAFSTLPYYQVSGALKSGEGEVAIGDPIAWNESEKKFIKYDAGIVTVPDEEIPYTSAHDSMGMTSSTKVFVLLNGNIIPGSYTVKASYTSVDPIEPKEENVDYWLDLVTGYIKFIEDPNSGHEVTVTYQWAKNAHLDKGKAVGFVRIPGNSGAGDVAIEVVIGGAVKRSVVTAADKWNLRILEDLKGKLHINGDALIF